MATKVKYLVTSTLTFVLKIALLDFVATESIVFHKHMYFWCLIYMYLLQFALIFSWL